MSGRDDDRYTNQSRSDDRDGYYRNDDRRERTYNERRNYDEDRYPRDYGNGRRDFKDEENGNGYNRRQGGRDIDTVNQDFARMSFDRNRGRGGFNSYGRGRGGYSYSRAGSFSGGSTAQTNSSGYGSLSGTTFEKKNNVAKADLPYQKQEFVARPSRMVQEMKLGVKTRLTTNFVRILLPEEPILLHQYNVKITVITSRGKKEETKREKTHARFWECVSQYRDQFPEVQHMIYNDVNILWTKRKLQRAEFTLLIKSRKDNKTTAEVEFKYAHPIEFCQKPRQVRDVQLLVCLIDNIATARVRCLHEEDYNSFSAFGHSMFLISDEAKKHEFGVPLTVPLGGGMEGWTGLHMAVKMNLLMGPMMNIDLSHSAFYKPAYSLVRLLADVISNKTLNDEEFDNFSVTLRKMGMQYAHRKDLLKILKGVTCMLNYGQRSRVFKVERITDKSARATYFAIDGGRQVTVAEYFYNKGMPLSFPDFPCVVGPKFNGQSSQSLFPLELVQTWDQVQKFKGRLPESQLARMIQRTAYPPDVRREIIRQLTIQNPRESRSTPAIVSSSDKWMKNYEVEVDSEFAQVDATILPAPKLVYGNSTFFDENSFGVWKCSNNHGEMRTILNSNCPRTKKRKVLVGSIITVQCATNAVMRSAPDVDLKKFETLMNSIDLFGQDVLRNEHGQPRLLYTNTYHQSMGVRKLREMLHDIKNHVAENFVDEKRIAVPFILFIFATKCTSVRNRVDIMSDYGVIKQLCDCEIGIHCQGILQKTMSSIAHDPRRCATAHNIAFKILSKIGSVHYKLERGGSHKNWTRFTDPAEPTLVLGVDVTHPSDVNKRKGGVASVSVACIIGNIDIEMANFRESSRIQNSGEESIVQMDEEVKTRITEFSENTGLRPAHLVVYRDGVSESEFKRILFEEKNSIESACSTLDVNYKPTLTYIVVSKRHHTRFFANSPRDKEGEFGNIKPGTLVEGSITTKDYYDFYLTSHFGAIGTSRPTHYYVLHDTWKPSDAFWPTITHALCYNYVRTTKSISVPSPVLYAHLAAKRAKDRLEAISNIHYDTDNCDLNLSNYSVLQRTNHEMLQHRDLDGMLFV